MKTSFLFTNLFLLLLFIIPIQAQITGTFTADNSYAVYIGNQSSVATKVLPNNSANGHTNNQAAQIFSPTQNTFNVNTSNYLYIIAWSDDSGCQGLLGEFTGNSSIKTGDSGWQVYPTKKNYGNNQAPTPSEINFYINQANSNNGWKAPFVGPRNIDGKKACNAYRKVNGISNDAKWIWNNTLNTNDPRQVLGKGRNHHEFLIFRFPVKQIIEPGTGNGGPAVSECDCIPEELYDTDLTSILFTPKDMSGPISNFTYKLKYKAHPQLASLGNVWNAWIKAKFGVPCQVIHQFILYEYTSNGSGGIMKETYLEQFWASPQYFPSSISNFNTVLKSNKKYYIKHGVYYGAKGGGKCPLEKECPWEETRYFISTSTGSDPKIIIKDEKGKVAKQSKVKIGRK